ncbi:MAG TPA: D-tyrosyl-tRNA(Tyr) deacylase [Elusimicrobia bacterium]|nr:D-tyrosyl-tRNA(Tyr) deacylase [Elusimicrobiota bacterium]HBT61569.1 D-tyrosyl-tRNA(Tyr) deacylase [Elusimicrobiota bacterium]
MRALIQRVSRASVRLPGGESRAIGKGLLVYLGVGSSDGEQAARRLAEKIVNLRIFANGEGKFDRSLLDEKGEALVVSQFTLFANVKGGRRPDFTSAAKPELAKPLYESFCRMLAGLDVGVSTGEFGAHMEIDSINDGPVTLWLDTDSF